MAAKRCTKKCNARVVFVFCLLLLHVLDTRERVVVAFNDLITRLINAVIYHRESDFLKACINAM